MFQGWLRQWELPKTASRHTRRGLPNIFLVIASTTKRLRSVTPAAGKSGVSGCHNSCRRCGSIIPPAVNDPRQDIDEHHPESDCQETSDCNATAECHEDSGENSFHRGCGGGGYACVGRVRAGRQMPSYFPVIGKESFFFSSQSSGKKGCAGWHIYS